jgi:CHAP domain
MPDIHVDEFMARATAAREVATLYWLGYGGWTDDDPPTPTPGTAIHPRAALRRLRRKRPEVAAAYIEGLLRLGLNLDELPRQACDCSGYVAWALKVRREPWPLVGEALWTTGIHADASGAQEHFQKLPRNQPRRGALMVYPWADGKPGHVGIVAATEPEVLVLHCSAANFELPPQPGLPRNAINQTDASLFDNRSDTLLVWARMVQG